jgi:hypothetical protein
VVRSIGGRRSRAARYYAGPPRLGFHLASWSAHSADAGQSPRIASEEFDEVGAGIGRALNDLNVHECEKQEVLAAVVARKDEVVDQSL